MVPAAVEAAGQSVAAAVSSSAELELEDVRQVPCEVKDDNLVDLDRYVPFAFCLAS